MFSNISQKAKTAWFIVISILLLAMAFYVYYLQTGNFGLSADVLKDGEVITVKDQDYLVVTTIKLVL